MVKDRGKGFRGRWTCRCHCARLSSRGESRSNACNPDNRNIEAPIPVPVVDSSLSNPAAKVGWDTTRKRGWMVRLRNAMLSVFRGCQKCVGVAPAKWASCSDSTIATEFAGRAEIWARKAAISFGCDVGLAKDLSGFDLIDTHADQANRQRIWGFGSCCP